MEVDDMGNVLEVIERKPEIRRILIRSFSPDKNVAQLAVDIVDKCKYIHPSRTEEIEQLLIKLRKHRLANANNLEDSIEVIQAPNNPNHPKSNDRSRENRDTRDGRDSRDTRDGRDGRDGKEY